MTWVLLLTGAAAGGFINGLAGFGTALFALGFWLQIMPPAQAVAIVAVVSAVTGLQGLWIVRKAISAQRRRLFRFLIPGLCGIPAGVAALSVVEPHMLKLVIGGFLVIYGGYFSLRKNLPRFERPTPLIDRLVGFLSGVLGGAASLSGALPSMWCSMRPWPKAETRAVLQPFNFTILGLTAFVLLINGVFTREAVMYLLAALPVAILSSRLGIMVFRKVSDDMFRRLLIGLTFISGSVLLMRELAL